MQYLFSKNGLRVLESLSFTKTLYAFDFDGTLSKIVTVPQNAKLSTTTGALLQELSTLIPVAVVSGRSIEDLEQKFPFQPRYLIGNHGLESYIGNPRTLSSAKKTCQRWKTQLETARFDSGVEIEDKKFSLSIHYRSSRNKQDARMKIKSAISALLPEPRVIMGKSVVNLLTKSSPHKGIAIMDLMKRLKTNHAFYIGDDDTDEDVFTMDTDRITCVRVGRKQSSQARYFIHRQSQINLLLKTLVLYQNSNRKN